MRYVVLVLAFVGFMALSSPPSDNYIRGRVVQLSGDRGYCTGQQVTAPSGKTYVLTAAHCREIAGERGEIHAVLDSGISADLKILAEDPNSDLLLLEGMPGLRGLAIANNSYAHEHVRTFSHGHHYATYKTEGELIQIDRFQCALFDIVSMEDKAKCESQLKTKVDGGMFLEQCILDVEETVTTVPIVPGSSGGAALDDSGRVVGIVTGTGGPFSFFVTLSDIKLFLAKY